MRVLLGGVGYRHLCDHSIGVLAIDTLAGEDWPPHVSVEDLSYGPVALVQRLEDDPPDRRFGRAVIAAAVERAGRVPGTVTVYRWDTALPGPERIQAAVADAVTGVIHLDNSLIVARHFDALPRHVVVVEVEPAAHASGEDLSPALAEAFPRVLAILRHLALDDAAAERVPLAPLGGGALSGRSPQVTISHAGARTD